ncbi:hypothetical protein OROMI_013264 [Orobanche minor]
MPPKASKSKEATAERPILGRFSSHLKIRIGPYRMGNEITRLTTMKGTENLDPDHHCLEYLNNKLSDEI